MHFYYFLPFPVRFHSIICVICCFILSPIQELERAEWMVKGGMKYLEHCFAVFTFPPSAALRPVLLQSC